MSAFTTWTRVEGHARTTDLQVGLAAEVADPLWFLGRQLQIGELKGEDGGSPVAIDVQASWSRFTRFRPEGTDAPAGEPIRIDAGTGPLETLVEREAQIRSDLSDATPDDGWAARVRAGRDLDRRLRQADLAVVADRLRTHALTTFRPRPPSGDAVSGPSDRRYLLLLAQRVIDGGRVVALRVAGQGLPDDVVAGVDAAHLASLEEVLSSWVVSVRDTWGFAFSDHLLPATWVRDRMEYAFSIAAPPLPDGEEVVLRATDYDGSGLEWYSLDMVEGATLGAAADGGPGIVETRMRSLLATPLTFPGMPAERFWEMEDAAVNLAATSAGPTDLARMLAIDFSVIYGRDWFTVPVEVPAGCVARIDWVMVRDTFGAATLVGTHQTQAAPNSGRQFQPSDSTPGEGDHPLLVVLPSALDSLRSAPREEVMLQRDELANLAWGIEQLIAGPTGRGVDTHWAPADFAMPPAVSPGHELIWRLATPVPPTWIPFVAGRMDNGARALVKARMLDTPTAAVRASRSRILSDVAKLRDEEVSGSGSRVRLVDQRVRWPDGRSFAWRGREKRPGRGEAASKLLFDAALPDQP